MYDCAHGVGEFMTWTFAQRLALVGDLTGLLTDTAGIFGIGCAVHTESFSQISEDDLQLLKLEHLGSPSELLLQLCIQQAVHGTRTNWNGEVISVFFDRAEPARVQLYTNHYEHYLHSDQYGPYLHACGVQDSKLHASLQAADMLAFGTYQMAMYENFPFEVPLYFPVLSTFSRLIKNVPAEGIAYDLEALRKLAQQVRNRH
jgi:hypothetical protein